MSSPSSSSYPLYLDSAHRTKETIGACLLTHSWPTAKRDNSWHGETALHSGHSALLTEGGLFPTDRRSQENKLIERCGHQDLLAIADYLFTSLTRSTVRARQLSSFGPQHLESRKNTCYFGHLFASYVIIRLKCFTQPASVTYGIRSTSVTL